VPAAGHAADGGRVVRVHLGVPDPPPVQHPGERSHGPGPAAAPGGPGGGPPRTVGLGQLRRGHPSTLVRPFYGTVPGYAALPAGWLPWDASRLPDTLGG